MNATFLQRLSIVFGALVCATLGLEAAGPQDGEAPIGSGIAFVGVRVLTMDEPAAVDDQTVVVMGQRIEALRGVMAEARRIGMPVAGHVPVEVGLEETLASGIRSIEHLTE